MTRQWMAKGRRLALPTALLLFAGVAGCSRPTGAVNGKVTFGGQSLNSGTVTFVPQEGATQSCSIEPDGGYALPKVSTGPCAISVVSTPPPPPMWNPQTGKTADGAAPGGPRTFIQIPARYADPEKSNLTYNVRSGGQKHDIDLAP